MKIIKAAWSVIFFPFKAIGACMALGAGMLLIFLFGGSDK